MQHMIGSQQHTRSVLIRSLQLALPHMGKYSKYTFVGNMLILKLSGCACRNHRGLRHYWGLRVKGQHTKTTGRRGKTVGVAKKR